MKHSMPRGCSWAGGQGIHLLLLTCLLFFVSGVLVLGFRDIYGMEARAGLFVRAMLSGEGFLCPLLYGRPYPDYVPGYFILSWLSCLPSGQVNALCLSLPSLVAGVLLLAYVFRVCNRHVSGGLGLPASLVLASSPKFWLLAQAATIDMVLALFCFAANSSLFHGYCREGPSRIGSRLAGFAFMVMAFMVKGPVGLFLASVPTGLFLLVRRRTEAVLSYAASASLTSILTAGTYMAALYAQGGQALVHQVLEAQLLSRLSGPANKPFYYYFLFLLVSFAPAVLCVAALSLRRARDLKTVARRFAWSDFGLFISIYATTAVVPFLLASSRHGRYLLPAFAPIAIVLGWWLCGTAEKKGARGPDRGGRLVWPIALMSLLPILLLFSFDPIESNLPFWAMMIFASMALALYAAIFVSRHEYHSGILAFLVSFLVVSAGAGLSVLPGLSKKESGRSFVTKTETTTHAKAVYLSGIRPDGDGLKYSLFSRFYPQAIHFLPAGTDLCRIPGASLVILYQKDYDVAMKASVCAGNYRIVSTGLLHGRKVVSLYSE